MRWKVKPSKDIFNWHSWFAWYPITVYSKANKRDVRVWLETIERRVQADMDDPVIYEYRLTIDEFHDMDNW